MFPNPGCKTPNALGSTFLPLIYFKLLLLFIYLFLKFELQITYFANDLFYSMLCLFSSLS